MILKCRRSASRPQLPWEIADHAAASARLAEARTIVTTKRQMLARVLDDQKREEAVLVFEQARV